MVDVDGLPPVQYLILETLAARYRLGEHTWSFPDRFNQDLDALVGHGLIGYAERGQNVSLAWFTDAGPAALLSETYVPPALRELQESADRLKAHAAEEYANGLRDGAGFLFGVAAGSEDGAETVTVWRAAEKLREFSEEIREAMRTHEELPR